MVIPQPGPRLWVAPFFNGTRDVSYQIEDDLGVQISGDQKLTPFPSWTLSTSSQTPDKRFGILSEPVSDWFVRQPGPTYPSALVAQSLESWHPPGVHLFLTLHNGIDFYYQLGGLINFYTHTLSVDGNDANGTPVNVADAHQLVPDSILYSLNASLHPRVWSANARDIWQWWQQRSPRPHST